MSHSVRSTQKRPWEVHLACACGWAAKVALPPFWVSDGGAALHPEMRRRVCEAVHEHYLDTFLRYAKRTAEARA